MLTFVIGCTGSGKGTLGRELARRTGGEIVSVDSMKVYRRMDIGTAKPSAQMRREIPHHLIDVVEPSEEFSVARYVELADAVIDDIHRRGKPILVVGGTPMYIKGLAEGMFEGPGADRAIRAALHETARREGSLPLYQRLQRVDPVAAGRIQQNDLRRIVRALEIFELTGQPISTLQTQWDQSRTRYDCVFIGLRRQREDQNHRTNQRVRGMIAEGLVDEVKSLLDEPEPLSSTAARAVGYAEILQVLAGRVSLAEAIEMIKIKTRQFAKAQRTWFKRFRQTDWIELSASDTVGSVADELLERRGSLWSV